MGEVNDLRREVKLEEPNRDVQAFGNDGLERLNARIAVPYLYR
jgi:hypothetical protein